MNRFHIMLDYEAVLEAYKTTTKMLSEDKQEAILNYMSDLTGVSIDQILNDLTLKELRTNISKGVT